ncbi:interleukin-12 subunit alpha [Leuresthes tenuis]|uniref:interleukin-12 subunit alpha n=1 Tax=Leuresthes tenuis TaxID=355514 RepID=UPI003B50E2AE
MRESPLNTYKSHAIRRQRHSLVFSCLADFASCVLLLTLSCRTSTGLPVHPESADNSAHCAGLFKGLLLNVTELLKSEDLCHGIIASSKSTVRNEDTVQACAPILTQNSGCMMQRKSFFNESECWQSIMKDLAYYDALIQHYLKSSLYQPEKEDPLLSPTLRIIQNLRMNCSPMLDGENYSSEAAANIWKNDSFKNRQMMCKMMRGFHVRAITINRAMGYISSGDHKK